MGKKKTGCLEGTLRVGRRLSGRVRIKPGGRKSQGERDNRKRKDSAGNGERMGL